MMKFLNLLVITLAAVSAAAAQEISLEKAGPYDVIEGRHFREAGFHNWGFHVSNMGLVLENLVTSSADHGPGGEYPRGSGNFLIFSSGFDIGVLKSPLASAPDYRYTVSQYRNFLPGPVLEPRGIPFDSLTADDPDAVENHVYLIDTSRMGDDWINWPCHDGAPCDSSNEPLLVSQQDTWCVFNDLDTLTGWCGQSDTNCVEPAHGFSFCYGCPPADSPIRGIGVEVQQSSYVFAATPDVVLIRWKVMNQTNVVYDSAYIGLNLDPDIVSTALPPWQGNSADDGIGTDTTRKMIYAYSQGDEITPTGLQYAVGVKILFFSQFPLLNSAEWQTAAYQVFNPGAPGWVDIWPIDSIRYQGMAGLDWDGTQRLASEGFVEDDNSPFVFPGYPETGQGLTSDNPLVWPNGEDVKGYISVGPFQLQPGVENDLIVAFIAGEDPDRLGAISDLRLKADQLQEVYDNYLDFFLGVDNTIDGVGAVAAFSPAYPVKLLPPFTVQFSDFSISNPAAPITSWKWDFENDGIYDSFEQNPAWTYPAGGSFSVKLVVANAEGSDSLIRGNLIETYSFAAFPFLDDFPTEPDPDPTKWINTTTHVSDKGKNEPSPPYSLALDSHPNVTSETLESYPFDLTGQSNPGIIILYEYQGKGSGNAPEPHDSLFVDLKNSLGEWVTAKAYPGEASDSFKTDFVDVNLIDPGPGASFYYPGFQFRFRNLSDEPRPASPHRDVWFIDDVKLDIVPGVGDGPFDVIPRAFKLHQNYPNPFNPSTAIRYDLPKHSKVTVKVYNVLGQEVRTLVDEPQTAGYRSVVWNGTNNAGISVSSGVYVYRIEARDFVKSRKMMLLR